jgi:flagellar basal body rod protein FlgF
MPGQPYGGEYMKKILIAVFAITLAATIQAKQDMVALVTDNVNTGATVTTDTSGMLFGEIQRLYITLPTGTNAYTANVILTISNMYSGETRTLYDNTVLGYGTNISIYPLTTPTVPIDGVATNWYVPFYLYDDVILMTSTNASLTNKSVKAYIYYDRE